MNIEIGIAYKDLWNPEISLTVEDVKRLRHFFQESQPDAYQAFKKTVYLLDKIYIQIVTKPNPIMFEFFLSDLEKEKREILGIVPESDPNQNRNVAEIFLKRIAFLKWQMLEYNSSCPSYGKQTIEA